MNTRNSLFGLLLAGSALLAAGPSFAQADWHPHPAHPPAHFVRPAGAFARRPGGFPHPFHAVVVAHTNFAHFTPAQRAVWTRGTWRHTWWNGRYGWWWNAGGVWFWYNAPVYPYPTVVSDYYYEEPDYSYDQSYGQGDGGQYWYYCQSPAGYYPYVRSCKGPWEPVPSTPAQGAYGDQGPGDEQGPPPGYGGDQGPPPGSGPGYGDEQGPPPDQGPGPGDDQGPPPNYDQGPPPGYNQGPPN
jgi:hypothetical protein